MFGTPGSNQIIRFVIDSSFIKEGCLAHIINVKICGFVCIYVTQSPQIG